MQTQNLVIEAINELRKQHMENESSSEDEEEDPRSTEVLIEKAGRMVKRNFPFEINWEDKTPEFREKKRAHNTSMYDRSKSMKRRDPNRDTILFDQNNLIQEEIMQKIRRGTLGSSMRSREKVDLPI